MSRRSPEPHAPICFLVRAQPCPNVTGRVIGLFAQQARVPSGIAMRRLGEAVLIRLVQDEVDPHRAAILTEKLRAIVTVRSVRAVAMRARLPSRSAVR